MTSPTTHRQKRLAFVSFAVAIALLAGDLAVKPASAAVEGGHARELPALESTAPPAGQLSVPAGNFTHTPSFDPGDEEPQNVTGFDGERSTVESRRTDRTTFLNPDGSRTARLYTGAVNYRDAAGTWTPIDTTIQSDGSGNYRNAAGPVRYSFESATGSGDLVRAVGDGWSLGFAPEGQVQARAARAEGSEVTYANALPDADLAYRVLPEALKETVVLKRAPTSSAQRRYSFPLTLQGLRAVSEGGGVTFYDASGEVAARIPPGVMWDSGVQPAQAPVKVTLARRNGRSVIDLDVDGAFLTDPARVYPVMIDPTLYPGIDTTRSDASVRSTTPNNNYSQDTLSRIGRNAGTTHRTFMRFDLTPLMGKQILTATWKSYFTTPGVSPEFFLQPVAPPPLPATGWAPGTLTWNNQPPVRPEWIQANAVSGWKTVSMLDWMKNWTSETWDDHGIRVHANESNTNYYKEMASADYATTSLRPYLEVTYNTLPPAPTAVAPQDDVTMFTQTPTFQVDPVVDTEEGSAVQYFFRIGTGDESLSGQIIESGWISSPTWTAPPGALEDGVTYYWRGWTSDGIGTTWSTWSRSFTVDTTGSSGPTDSLGPATVSLGNGNLGVGFSSPSYATVGGDIGLSYSYNSQEATQHGLKATFFNDADQDRVFDAGESLTNRVDRHIDFAWGPHSAQAATPSDNFLVRWEGKLTVPTTGTYYFGAASDDGVKIWVNNLTTPVVDRWSNQTATAPVYGSSVSLTAGQPVDIKIEYYDATGDARLKLAAKGPSIPDDVTVPSDWLSTSDTADSSLPPGWTLSHGGGLSFLRAVVTNDAVTLVSPDGSTTEFERDSSGFTPAEGDHSVLATDAATGKLTLDSEDGHVYTFRADGTLESARSTNEAGAAAPVYSWTGSPTRLQSITDPVSGRSVALSYGGGDCPAPPGPGFDSSAPQNMLCRVTYWDGKQTHLFYVGGQLARIQDPGGAVTDFAYASGKLSKIRDELAADAVAAGQRADDDSARTVITYDGQGRVSSIELPAPTAGAARPKSTYTYSPGQADVDVAGISGQPGYDRRVLFNAQGDVTEERGPDGLATTFEYDAADGNLLSSTDPTGRKSTTIYDTEGRATDTYGPAPAAWFGADGLPLAAHVSQVSHESIAYDEDLQGLAAAYWTTADLAGQPECYETGVGEPSGAVDRNWGSQAPACLSTGVAAWSGRLTGEIIFPTAGTYTLKANSAEGVRVFVDDVEVIAGWTTPGWLTSTALATTAANEKKRIRVEFRHTSGGPAALIKLNWIPPGQAEQTVPGASLLPDYGLSTSHVTDDDHMPGGEVQSSTEYEAPHSGLADSASEGSGGTALTTSATYEQPGPGAYSRQLTRTLPAGNTWNYVHYADQGTLGSSICGLPASTPQAGFLRSQIGPDPDGAESEVARVEEFVYDDAGRQSGSRIGAGAWSCASFDSRGRVTQQTHPAFSGEPARTVSYDYAVGGNPFVSSVSDPLGTITSTIDLLGRVVSYTDVWGKTTTTLYNQNGALTSTSGPAGLQEYVYDSVTGRLTSQKLDSDTIAELTYGTASEVTSVTYPDGSGKAGNGTSLTITRDAARDPSGEVTGLRWNKISGGLIAADDIMRSQSGRVIDQAIDDVDPHIGENFVYDPAGRLVNAWVPGRSASYSFADSGGCSASTAAGKNTNRTSMSIDGGPPTSYCYDHADRLTSTTDARYSAITYDGHGNTVTLGQESLVYDGADRHVQTTKGSTTIRYARDAMDRIVERMVNGAIVSQYGYAGPTDGAGFTLDASNAVVERTVPLPGGATVTKRGAGDVWSYPSLHGDIFAIANASGVKDGSTRHYDSFGEALGVVPDNSTGAFDYAWLGQHLRPLESEAATATIEMGARPYVPGLGRFLEVDPIEGGSANDYDYTAGDPVNATDLDGRFCNFCQRMWHLFRYRRNFRWTVAGWAIARSQGATCKWRKGLMVVCTGARWAGFRGGMTIGNTYITTERTVSARLLAHETKHSDQWAIFGWLFVPLYLLAEAVSWIWGARDRYAGCKNFFEKWAGLVDGRYRC